MLLQGLQNTPSLEISHLATLDDFRSFERLAEASVLPLTGRSSSVRAEVKLSNCRLVVQRTFPRILKINFTTDSILCLVPLTPPIGFKVNATTVGSDSVVVVRGQADCHIVEPKANLIAIVTLNPSSAGFTWLKGSAGVQIVR